MVGGTLTLDCTIDIPSGIIFVIKWILPNKNQAINEQRAIIQQTVLDNDPKIDHMQIGRSRLVINKVTNDDIGDYVCEVRDHSSNFNENKRYINVLGMFIKLNKHI